MLQAAVARGLAALLVLALAGGAAADPALEESAAAASAPASASASASAPAASTARDDASAQAIENAVAALREDPLLSGKHKVHRLEFKDKDKPEKKHESKGDSLDWLRSFASFLNDTSRLLVYGLALVVVALVLVSARRFVQLRQAERRIRAAGTVSHVRDLDVRPESLPADIGAAAWTLWQAGNAAAALSLLYRGALSRLIHRHEVPIAASTTEGECLGLARGHLAPAAHRYLTQLVLAWEAVTYGQRVLSPAMGEALCQGFATRLDAAPGPAPAPAPQGDAA
jgi:hypothetical protein